MSTSNDPKPFTISYDKNKDKYSVLRRSDPVYHCDTEEEAKEWIATRGARLRPRLFFYHELKPTKNPMPREKAVAKW